jgi:hypothetical protein
MGTCSLRTEPPDKEGIEIPIREKALDAPSDDGRKVICERYSGLARTKAFNNPRARTTTKLILIRIRRFHRNNRNLSKYFSFFGIAKKN